MTAFATVAGSSPGTSVENLVSIVRLTGRGVSVKTLIGGEAVPLIATSVLALAAAGAQASATAKPSDAATLPRARMFTTVSGTSAGT